MVYKDKDGLPVTYDAAIKDKKTPTTKDDLSVFGMKYSRLLRLSKDILGLY